VEEPAQLVVVGWVVRRSHCSVVLPEELLTLSFGKLSQDHQRIGGVFRRLCGHITQLTLACSPRLGGTPAEESAVAAASNVLEVRSLGNDSVVATHLARWATLVGG